MIKKSSISVYKYFKSFFVKFIIILTLIISTFIYGIKIDNIDIFNTEIKELYIKWDKKLILKANNIIIKRNNEESSTTSSSNELHNLIDSVKNGLDLFQQIDIKSIEFGEEKISLLYENELFYIDTNRVNLLAFISYKDHTIDFDIKSLYLKKERVLTSLSGSYNIESNISNALGKIYLNRLELDILVNSKDNYIDLELNSNIVKSIESIKEYVKLNNSINSWIFDKVKAKKYQLEKFKIRLDRDSFKPDLDSIYGKVNLFDATVKFNKKINSAISKKIIIEYKNENLSFDIKKPTYLGKRFDIKLSIDSLLSNPFLNLNIVSSAKLKSDILYIIQSYGINLPIFQKTGQLKTNLDIIVDLKKEQVFIAGEFDIFNSTLIILDKSIYIKKGRVKLLDSGLIEIQNSIIEYKSIKLDVKKAILDIKNKKISGFAKLKKFDLISKKIVDLRDFSSKFTIYFSDESIDILIDSLANIKIIRENSLAFDIDIKSLKDIKKLSPILSKIPFEDGELKIDFEDINAINIESKLNFKSIPIMIDNQDIQELKISGSYTNKELFLSSEDRKLNFYYKDYLQIDSNNVDFIINNRVFKSESSNINIFNSGKIELYSKYKNSTLKFEKIDDFYDINIKKASLSMVESFLNKKLPLTQTFFDIYLFGENSNLKGVVKIGTTTIKEFALLNNIIALLDKLPSILLLDDSKFSTKGFKVKNGLISFRKKSNLITIDEAKLNGFSMNLKGFGEINSKTEQIDMDLVVEPLTNSMKIINYIPLVNYVLLGKDGNITLKLNAKGDINNPTTESRILENIIDTPLHIINRVLLLPVEMIKE